MKITITFFLLSFTIGLSSQDVADFEEFNLLQDTFNNGSDRSGGFKSGGVYLPNNYSEDFDAWTGWALSTKSDTLSPGFSNQYSCIAGEGADGTATYAVGYAFDPVIINMQDSAGFIEGLYVCNAAYPYLSMRDGDSFSKKFGGISGADPDFFKLTVKKYLEGILVQDSVEFYLADFRFDNAAEDFIVKDWTYVDLTPLGSMDSVQLSLSSSDVGIFGMNTPAYFCLDRISTRDISTSLTQENLLPLQIFPNPVMDFLQLEIPTSSNAVLSVYRFDGLLVCQERLTTAKVQLDVSQFAIGHYQVLIRSQDGFYRGAFMKY